MHTNRDPIRDIRNKYYDNTDRFAEFHERRVDPEHEVRAEEDYPLAVIHIAPKLAFSKAATRFTVPDLLNREVRLHTGSNRPRRPEMMFDRVTSTTDPAPQRVDILPALKREDSHGTVPLGWDIVVYDVTCS